MKSILLLVKKGPYGVMHGLETARFAKDLKEKGGNSVHVIALDDGVYFYLKNQESEKIGTPPFITVMTNTDKIKIPLYALKESLDERNISEGDFDPELTVKIISRKELSDLIREVDSVVSM